MILSSWNINSVRIREELILRFINKVKPNILFLQEIKCEESQFPYLFFENLNYDCFVIGQKARNGVAIAVKKDIKINICENINKKINTDLQARFIMIHLVDHDIDLCNVYVPNGNPVTDNEKFEYKVEWLKNLKCLLESYIYGEKKLILGGDFNVLENFKDVKNFNEWKNDALGHKKIINIFREIIGLGMFNVIRKFFLPGEKFSFWDYQKAAWDRNDGLLIDHFLVTPNLIDKINTFDICSNFRGLPKPSDHVPIWMKIDQISE